MLYIAPCPSGLQFSHWPAEIPATWFLPATIYWLENHSILYAYQQECHITILITGDREGRRSGTEFNRIIFAISVACMSNTMHGCNLHALHMHDVLSAPPCLLQMQQLALLLHL